MLWKALEAMPQQHINSRVPFQGLGGWGGQHAQDKHACRVKQTVPAVTGIGRHHADSASTWSGYCLTPSDCHQVKRQANPYQQLGSSEPHTWSNAPAASSTQPPQCRQIA